MECLCAAKISVNAGMCFNGNIKTPWVWKLHWRGFYVERNIFWKSWFHKYIFNGLLSPTVHFWIFRKNNGIEWSWRWEKTGVVSNNDYYSDSKTQVHLKACVRYFLSNFQFFIKWKAFKNHEECFLFYLNSSFQFFVIFLSSFPHYPDSKGQMEVE